MRTGLLPLLARYRGASDAAWPQATGALAKIGGKDLAGVSPDLLRPIMAAKDVAGDETGPRRKIAATVFDSFAPQLDLSFAAAVYGLPLEIGEVDAPDRRGDRSRNADAQRRTALGLGGAGRHTLGGCLGGFGFFGRGERPEVDGARRVVVLQKQLCANDGDRGKLLL